MRTNRGSKDDSGTPTTCKRCCEQGSGERRTVLKCAFRSRCIFRPRFVRMLHGNMKRVSFRSVPCSASFITGMRKRASVLHCDAFSVETGPYERSEFALPSILSPCIVGQSLLILNFILNTYQLANWWYIVKKLAAFGSART